MEKTVLSVPFGLTFEEPAPKPRGLIIPTYDEEADLSYVEISDGRRIPYVEYAGLEGTETLTRVASEHTDQDVTVSRQLAGTDTLTEVRRESTDTDPGDDQGTIITKRLLMSTDTFTKVRKEDTDVD